METRTLGPDGPTVSRIGFGGMQLSLANRPPEADSIRAVHVALDLGVTLIDTADVYCLDEGDIGHNERLIARALASWQGDRSRVIVATKGGLRRPKGAWTRDARPASLRAACEASLRALGRESIDLYQLHAVDPEVPIAESVGALARLREEGKIRHVGLSNVDVANIETASAIVPISSVQNRWSPMARDPETNGVLAHCTERKIAFLPYAPFGGSSRAKGLSDLGTLGQIALAYGVSAHRLVLAWMLAKSPVVFPIPGSQKPESIRDCVAAESLRLTRDDGDIERIEASFLG